MVIDTLGHLLALHVTSANKHDRDQADELARRPQEVTEQSVELAYADQGYTGDRLAEAAEMHSIALEVVKLPEAKRGFVSLPRRWAVERSFGWLPHFRRLARDHERMPKTVAGLHLLRL
jgi:transposase